MYIYAQKRNCVQQVGAYSDERNTSNKKKLLPTDKNFDKDDNDLLLYNVQNLKIIINYKNERFIY